MPRVQEYLPENEAAGPVGALSPDLQQTSLYGRGIEKFGGDLTEALHIVHQRDTQAEISDANAAVSDLRSQYAERIQQETNDGTINVDKIKEDYQKDIEAQADNYSTGGGKNAFNRLSARTGGAIVQHASIGYANAQGAKAKEDITVALNKNTNIVESDPSQFADVRESQREYLNMQVESGAIKPAQLPQYQKAIDTELSRAAVRGYMQSDYNALKQGVIASGGKVDPEQGLYNQARTMLDKGGFDQFLDTNEKQKMRAEIRQNQVAAQTEGMRVLSLQDAANGAKYEAWAVNANKKLMDNTLSADEITAAAKQGFITPDKQLQYYHLIDQASKKEIATDPKIKNDLMQRILSPDNEPGHISSPDQLAAYVGKGISLTDHNQLAAAIDKSPAGKVNRMNEDMLMKYAKSKLASPSAMFGMKDPDGQYKMMMFSNDLQQAKQDAIQKGESVKDLLDPHSPKFFGNKINNYISSPQDIMAKMADQARGNAPAPTNIQTQPGVIPSQGNQTVPTPVEAFSVMSKEDLIKFKGQSLSPAQRAAASARWNALKQGK